METKLSKNIIFVKCFEPYDYTKSRGQLAVEVTYTDGDTDMLLTKSSMGIGSSFDFADESEFYKFIKFLQENKIPKK